jgi:hypothetical protein
LLSPTTTTTTATNSALLDREIEETAAGLSLSYSKHLRSTGKDNATIITRYIAVMKNEVNLSDNYRRDIIEVLSRFSRYYDNKPFKDLTRIDVVTFLDSFRKTEAQDPMHKWIVQVPTFVYLWTFFFVAHVSIISTPRYYTPLLLADISYLYLLQSCVPLSLKFLD